MTAQTIHIFSTNDSMLADEPQVFSCGAEAMGGYYRCCLIEHPEEPNRHFMIHREDQ